MRLWIIGLLALPGFAPHSSPQSAPLPPAASVCALPSAWSADAPDRLSEPDFDGVVGSLTWVGVHQGEFSRIRAYGGPRTRGPAACRAATNADRAAEELRSQVRRGMLVVTGQPLGGGRIFYCLNDAEKQRLADLATQIDINRRTLDRQCSGSD